MHWHSTPEHSLHFFILLSSFRDARLREIQMSEYDAEMYESFSSRVRRQVQSLRVILDSLQARGKERVWLRNQTSGELDDGKLIEGLTGERAIYKKRGDEDPEVVWIGHSEMSFVSILKYDPKPFISRLFFLICNVLHQASV